MQIPFLHRFLFGLFCMAAPYTWNENKGGVSMRKCDSFMGRLFLLCVSNIGLQLLGFVYRIFLSRFAGAEGLGVYRLAFSVMFQQFRLCLDFSVLKAFGSFIQFENSRSTFKHELIFQRIIRL